MSDVVYRIVEHDGGWAYKVGDVFSETFPTRSAAEKAASSAAAEQGVPGDSEAIEWQDESGRWHEETERGDDRPRAYVEGRQRPAQARAAEPRAPRRPTPPPPPRATGMPVAHVLLAGAVGALAATLLARRKS